MSEPALEPSPTAPAAPPPAAAAPSAPAPAAPAPAPNGGKPPIAATPEATPAPAEPAKPYWPEDWREKMAAHTAAGDNKAYEKELRRLQRFADPFGIYGTARELESKFSSGGLVKVPAKDAKPEEVAEFHKALGVPEKPEDYFKDLKLDNGAVLGDQDMPVAKSFAEAIHKVGAPPQVAAAALNWYYQNQEAQAAQLDEMDDTFRTESEKALKEELGPAFKRKVSATAGLFATAVGGIDVKNDKALRARLLGGRMADGSIIGNDPDFNRWMISLAHELNPTGSVVEDGDQSGKSMEDEITSIEERMRKDRAGYFKDTKMQARYRELLDARSRSQARNKA